MAAIKLAIIFFTLSPLFGAYHARHIHDGCIYQSLDQRPPGKTMAEVIQMVTGEEEPQSPPPLSSSMVDTIYALDTPIAGAPSQGETIYSGDNPKAPSHAVYGGDYLNAQPSPVDGGTGGGEAAYGRDNPTTPPHLADVCGNDGSSCADSASTFDGRSKQIPLRGPAVTSDIQIEEDDDQTVLSIASHWLLSYIITIFNNWE